MNIKRTTTRRRAENGKNQVTRPTSPPTPVTIYVCTCQRHERLKFTAHVFPSSQSLEKLQLFLVRQWQLTRHPLAEIPLHEHSLVFQGRLCRANSCLDSYYIRAEDEVYLRIASWGPVTDPRGMSSAELRQALETRKVDHVEHLRPVERIARLELELRKETRLARLHDALRQDDLGQVADICHRCPSLTKGTRRGRTGPSKNMIPVPRWEGQPRPESMRKSWPFKPTAKRVVFLSIAQLEQTYQGIPYDVIDHALMCFDTDRRWVFQQHISLKEKQFDHKYMKFKPDFLEILQLKEEAGQVFWFRPEKSFSQLSEFLTQKLDPVTNKRYHPLLLKPAKWMALANHHGWEGTIRVRSIKPNLEMKPRFTKSLSRVVTAIESSSFEYTAVCEILYQANPTSFQFVPL